METTLGVSADTHLIPAHVWTPWFSLFGSKSGFDSLEECFEDLSRHIFAVETGLSSDPPMNWRLSALDDLALVSNSDAHSPSNLGREANIFDTDLSYFSIFKALKLRDPRKFLGTIEFFPEEGKYHYDGHRKCNMRMSPRETLENGDLCPSCGRPVTIGVMHRVEELADREEGFRPKGASPFRSLLTLPEIIAQIRGVGPQTNWAQAQYRRLLDQHGPEFTILMDLPLDDLEARGDDILAEGLRRMRQGELHIAAGYDGEFGAITLFTPEDRERLSGQESLVLFKPNSSGVKKTKPEKRALNRKGAESERTEPNAPSSPTPVSEPVDLAPEAKTDPTVRGLNPRQKEAVCHWGTPVLIVAGPGTGKTLTLTRRIAHLIRSGIGRPEQVLAITFTNKAAEEMRGRLTELLEEHSLVTVRTFHALGYQILSEQMQLRGESAKPLIVNDVGSQGLLEMALSGLDSSISQRGKSDLLQKISRVKQNLLGSEAFETSDPGFAMLYRSYERALERTGRVDLDDLLVLPVRHFERHPGVLAHYQERFRFISVDEYQDINYAQYRLIQLLSPGGENLCVIGDPDQAIYGFRGADSRYFLQFEKDYPNAEIVRLEQNYRSSETILRASASLMIHNSSSLENRVWSGISGDGFLSIAEYPTDKTEAESIVHAIEQLVGGTSHFSLDSGRVDVAHGPETRSFSDFAVLYRLHSQGEKLEEAFERSGIPFRRIGGVALENHETVKQVLQVLRKNLDSGKIPDLRKEQDQLAPQSEGGIGHSPLAEIIKRIAEDLGFDPTGDALKVLAWEAEGSRGDMAEFLACMALRSDLDTFDPRAEKVTLMTLHASKGLEFPIVFIAGCEADLLPYGPKGRSPAPVEEERRLFYVGLTRGKEKVFLTRARRRTFFGQPRVQEASPFLKEIEDYLRQVSAGRRKPPSEKRRRQLDLF